MSSSVDRRKFLTVLGVTGGGAVALSGCSTDRVQKLVPYLVQSEDQVPGVPTWYASTCTECSAGCGVHVKTREGRAIKLEGNPSHPVNKGKLCARGQAALQGLYNPSRIKEPMLKENGAWKEITWDDAIARLAQEVRKAGGRIAVLTTPARGTFSDLLDGWTEAAGGTVTRWEPLDLEPVRMASRMVYNTDAVPGHNFAAARFILGFGDFLETWNSPTEQQIGYAESHGWTGEAARHVQVGARRDLTGLNADEFLSAVPGTEAAVALAMANVVSGGGSGAFASLISEWSPEAAERVSSVPAARITAVAREFASASPGIAVAGGIAAQGENALALAVAVAVLNSVAGNVGRTVLPDAAIPTGDGLAGMQRLMSAMEGGQVGLLMVHDANPAYALPGSYGFADKMAKVPFKVSTGIFLDETAEACDLLLPNLHALERWDDLRARPGVTGLMQPVMEPVFPGRHTGDVLLGLAKALGGGFSRFTAATFEEHLKQAWSGSTGGDAGWRAALAMGGAWDGAPAPAAAGPAAPPPPPAPAAAFAAPAAPAEGEFTLVAFPHAFLYDGRGANRPWLLENPDPVTKITWHPWAEISLETARRLDIRRGEIIRLVSDAGSVELPAYPYAGLHDQAIAVPLGFGHTAFAGYSEMGGPTPLDLMGPPGSTPWITYAGTKVRLEKTHRFRDVATTEGTPRQLGRGIAEAMPAEYARQGLTVKEAHLAAGMGHHELNTPLEVEAIAGWREEQTELRKLGDYAEEHPAWGMTVDLSRCTGCSACVTACYAENNIPTVGYDDVLRGREMSWMRIERYWEGGQGGEDLEARFVPMMCQHCENAPCEPVCPVYAAYHTVDGLNGQVYNRCVGTRYCANNCPYKVRYFNWYKYNEKAWPDPLHLQLNPDVTVRARGVMEKCTFCIQRIRGAQHQARLEDRQLADGEFTTACAQACPSGAIIFGNRRDPESRVAESSHDPRGYVILEMTNVRSSVTYLAKVLHPSEDRA